MARYSLQFKKSVAKDLRSIPKRDVQRILKRIESLADNPRPSGAEKLSTQDLYRIRQGRYRTLYQIRDKTLVVIVIKIGDRDRVYR